MVKNSIPLLFSVFFLTHYTEVPSGCKHQICPARILLKHWRRTSYFNFLIWEILFHYFFQGGQFPRLLVKCTHEALSPAEYLPAIRPTDKNNDKYSGWLAWLRVNKYVCTFQAAKEPFQCMYSDFLLPFAFICRLSTGSFYINANVL